MKKKCGMRDFRKKKSGNAESGPSLPEPVQTQSVIALQSRDQFAETAGCYRDVTHVLS